jgi:carbamoyltransferase
VKILGLNAYHGDAAACLVVDGVIVAAAEEERFRRVKHWSGFPTEAVRYCLAEGNAELRDIDHVAINSNPKANLLGRLHYALLHVPSLPLIVERLRHQGRRFSILSDLRAMDPGSEMRAHVHRIEHHIAHLASCFLVSPYREAVAVSVDGFGDFASAAWGIGKGNTLNVAQRVFFPHSLGIFYQAFTQYLGFPNYGDEYKVMGLAPYGQPVFLPRMREIVTLNDDGEFALNLQYFRHHREPISFQWQHGAPKVGSLFSDKLCQVFGKARAASDQLEQRHYDIARSVQGMYEEAFFNLLNALHKHYKVNNLTLSGGCAMNSVANGKVRRMTPFNEVYVQPAAGDAGGSIGAALHVWHKVNGQSSFSQSNSALEVRGPLPQERYVLDHAYLGPRFTDETIGSILEERHNEIEQKRCRVERVEDVAELCERTAQAVSEGLVVGWFQGRMEWGPRALGNRSIICDPRRADMKEILNHKIKRRESFRPFAPAILREQVLEWFEQDADVPFMMQVFQIRESKRPLVPAVVHVDGSGRLQTVHRKTNSRFYRLIESFQRRTGVPMVLNTSFNENEPVVCHPREALNCFLRTEMDWVVLENWIVRRDQRKS